MQQFTVPQFIDVEDKIIGPVTTRQFIIMLSGFIFIGISYKIFDFSAFLTVSIIIFIISGTFAFAKINGRPFHFFVLNFIQTLKRANLRVWNHVIGKTDADYKWPEDKTTVMPAKTGEAYLLPRKHYTTSRLSELALIVDTRGMYKGEEKGTESEIKSIRNN